MCSTAGSRHQPLNANGMSSIRNSPEARARRVKPNASSRLVASLGDRLARAEQFLHPGCHGIALKIGKHSHAGSVLA